MIAQPRPKHDKRPRWMISPVFAGGVVGLAGMTLLFPGGYDGWLTYLRAYFPQSTAPGVAHLFLSPVTLLPPFPAPYRWTALVLVTVIASYAASKVFGTRWWLAIFSVPVLWNIWLGQVELFPVIGLALVWMVLERDWHPAWFGVGALLLLFKVQVGYGIVPLVSLWLIQKRGLKALFLAVLTAVVFILISEIVYPGWIVYWPRNLESLHPQGKHFNSALFPAGLLAWLFALAPLKVGRMGRLRLFAAATLLGSPYFANYHATLLMTLNNRVSVFVVSWVTILPMVLFPDGMYSWTQKFAWLIPVAVIVTELWQGWRGRQTLLADAQ